MAGAAIVSKLVGCFMQFHMWEKRLGSMSHGFSKRGVRVGKSAWHSWILEALMGFLQTEIPAR